MGHGKDLVQRLVEVLYDSERGLAELGDCIRDAQLATFFKHESEARVAYARGLEMTASLLDEDDSPHNGRHYWEFMAINEDDSDEILLAIAREGEEVTMKAYQKVLTGTALAPEILDVLEKQRTYIEISGRLVRSFRTLRAA